MGRAHDPSGSEFQISRSSFHGDKWCLALNPRWQHEFSFVDTFPHVYRLRLKQNIHNSTFFTALLIFFSSLLFHSFFTSLNSISFFIFIVCPFFDLFQELRTFNVLGASPFILPKKMRKLLIIMRNFIPNHDKRKEGEGKKGERIVWLAGWFMIAGKLKSKPFHLDLKKK